MHLGARRRQLAVKGRPMTLRRLTAAGAAPTDVAVQGHLKAYRPEQLTGDIRMGDAQVAILNDEISAAAWPGPPRARDQMVIDGRLWSVQGAFPVYEGATCIGFDVWVRGG